MGRCSTVQIHSPAISSQGSDTRPDGDHKDEARILPCWQTTSVVCGREGGGHGVMVELKAALRGGAVEGPHSPSPPSSLAAVLWLILGKAGQEPTIRPLG